MSEPVSSPQRDIQATPAAANGSQSSLEDLYAYLSTAEKEGPKPEARLTHKLGAPTEHFHPKAPDSLEALGIPQILIEDLIFKLLLTKGTLSGRDIALHLCIPFAVAEGLLADLKTRLLLGHQAQSDLGDFIYILSEKGRERGLMARDISAYIGAVPVPFAQYLEAMHLQSIRWQQPAPLDLERAFKDLVLSPDIFETLGPALNSGRGLFIYGQPGNGKTSIAERLVRCYSDTIYIPHALWVDGEIIKLYDPEIHEEASTNANSLAIRSKQHDDDRWVKIERPFVVVGGELTMDALEIFHDPQLHISQAPLQLKANGGVFLIDDFGRQRMAPDELLNRWIVPLEKRVDYLRLANGKKIEVPFDEIIVFSTNLDPKDLVDEAFLRRIPYKIEIGDPDEATFRSLLTFFSKKFELPLTEDGLNAIFENYKTHHRPYRCCQARDILEQIVNACYYRKTPLQMTPELVQMACKNYFAAMGQAG